MALPYITAQGPQPEQLGEKPSNLAKVGFAGAGLIGTGFIPTKTGRVWDTYLKGIRAAETTFPAAILRTFRISEFLSPFENWNKLAVPAEQMVMGGKYAEFLRNTFGSGIDDISMTRTGAVFGDIAADGKTLGMGLRIKAGTQKGVGISDYFARITGTTLDPHQSLNEALLKAEYIASEPLVPYKQWIEGMEPHARRRDLILGVKFRDRVKFLGQEVMLSEKMQRHAARVEVYSQLMRAKAASTVGRLNTLLSKPFEFLPERVQKLSLIKSMAVKPGSAMQMAGRYMKKAVVAGAIWKGLEYYDYQRSKGGPWATALGVAGGAAAGGLLLKGAGRRLAPVGLIAGAAAGLYTSLAPRFDEGLFHGVASVFTDLNLARAKASQATGLSKSLQRQEDISPGLISTKTAIGFGGVGMMASGLVQYGGLLRTGISETIASKGETIADIFEKTREARTERMGRIWETKLGKKAAKLPGGKLLSKVKHPMALGFLGGLAAWGVLSAGTSLLSGNVGAAIPGVNLLGTTETPEELEAIYSGKKEVAIRKGRWWEFGRCLASRCNIPLCSGEVKRAEEIKVGDSLYSSYGTACEVLTIWQRKYSGVSYSIYSVLDKNIPTEVTGNHKIPVLTKEQTYNYEVLEKEAKNINIGNYVQVPIPELSEDVTELIPEDLIKIGLFLLDKNNIYPAQKNWHHERIQRSRGYSIPRIIYLTPELGRLFGYFLAEGNLSFKDTTPQMIETVHAKSERWIVDDIISICEKEFNISPTVRFKTTGKKTKEGCWIVRICSSLLSRVFFELFYKSDRQQDKIFPQIFMSASKNFKAQLVEGYWRGDGHLEKNTRILSSCRKDLVDKTQTILLNLGYYPIISKFESNDYRGRYKLRWDQYGRYEGKGFHGYFKQHDNKLYAKIQKIIIKEYSGLVYDFEVDHPDHLFQAGTFLVHNSSGYEGGRIEYYRPHALHRLKTRAYQKGLYGDEEERWEYDPMLHPLKALMGDDEWKYHHEQKYQHERPAPLTSTYFEDVPFFGPLLAATLGKAIKPRKLIRSEEWMIGEGEYKHLPDIRGETEPAYELGGLGPGAPVAPEEGSQLFNELMYRRREAVGLVGFAEGAMEKVVTGREEVFKNLQTIGTMGKETGSEYWLWSHMNIGGGLGTSEPIRRFIPHTRSYLETYNPLKNTAIPSWMPQDYFLDLTHGNPFEKVKEAEIRLPGPGYASLHPEVEGLRPEQYPLAHRLKILGDVAMWSSEYRDTLAKAKKNMHLLSDQERSIVRITDEQVKSKKERRNITEYRFRPELLKEQEITVSKVLDPRRIQAAEFGNTVIELQGMGAIKNMDAAMEFARDTMEGKKITIKTPSMESRKFDIGQNYSRMKAVAMLDSTDYGQVLAQKNLADAKELRDEFEQLRFTPREHLAGRLSESILHKMETPMEMLTPISPAAKLIRQRSAIEEYIQTEAIGTGSAFWDKPVENFLKPAADMALHEIGFSQIPENIRQRRDINEYFDMLTWTKSEHAESKARQIEDLQGIRKQQEIQQKTLFGLDVFDSPVRAMRALPRRERDFFAAFIEAPSTEERQQIVSLIPENEQRLYIANWMRQEEQAARAKKEAGIGTKYDEQIINSTQMMRQSEGFGITSDLEEQWMEETGGNIPYDEWIRTKKAEEYFTTHSLPGADWLGWHPSVDLDDVKLKYVEQAGLDHHDFDLWGARQKSLARKPYINAEMIAEMGAQADFDEIAKTRSNAKAIGGFYSSSNVRVNVSQIAAPLDESYNIEIVDGREDMVRKAYKNLGAR